MASIPNAPICLEYLSMKAALFVNALVSRTGLLVWSGELAIVGWVSGGILFFPGAMVMIRCSLFPSAGACLGLRRLYERRKR